MSQGRLPNLSRLCANGAWGPLRTTFPPVSPVAWTTCLTGVPPAAHGIRDFIIKSADTYLPTIGLFHVRAGGDGIPVYGGRRKTPMMGERLSELGRTSYLLQVPGTFPPHPIRGGMLAGFGMPDLVGSFGVSAWYTTDVEGKKDAAPEGLELIHPLTPAGQGVWRGQIAGPQRTSLVFVIRRDGSNGSLYLESSAGQPVAVLSAGMWSGWVRLDFSLPGRGSVPGICRFKLVSLGQTVELYRTAVQCAPDLSLYPLAEPPGFGVRLQSLVGTYATLGMPGDVDGVRRAVVDADTFLEDAYANWEKQVAMALALMSEPAADGKPAWDLLMTHLFTIDNVQHLFWHCQDPDHPAYTAELNARYGAEIERAYCWLDDQVRRLIERAPDDTTVMVVSDHGGVPIYRLVYLNAWLQMHGYLESREASAEGVAARLNWDRTRAAMFGTGAVWLNVQGREPRGIVPPGAPYEALRREIMHGLLDWRDPETGRPVVKEVLTGENVFGLDTGVEGPDLVVALYPGYGLGRGEALGRVLSDTPLIVPNRTPWSGGHEGPYLPSDVPGICVLGSERQTAGQWGDASLADIVPTVFDLLGLSAPPEMAGRSLL
jgi:predicted AlkP superfamily phosphohydrolase/phosphomutase